jgi:hypothetical protein
MKKFCSGDDGAESSLPLSRRGMNAKLEGQDGVKSLYRMWAETNQSIFYVENEQVAVADNFIASTSIFHQQVSRKSLMFNRALSHLPSVLSDMILKRVLSRKSVAADENAMYLYSNFLEMVWRRGGSLWLAREPGERRCLSVYRS